MLDSKLKTCEFKTDTADVRFETMAVFTLAILPDARTVRERYASSCPCTHCFHCVGFVRYTQTTSEGVLNRRERFASGWRCSVNARVDASSTAATHCLRMSADWPIYFHSINLQCGVSRAYKSWHCGMKVIRWLINIQEVEIGQMTAEKRFPDISLVSTWSTSDTIDIWPGKRDIYHELSTCNWVTTGRKADAVCTRRTVRVTFASGQSLVVWMQIRREVDPTRTVR